MGLEDLCREVSQEIEVDILSDIELYGWQKELFDAESRYKVTPIGRQGGKSFVVGHYAIDKSWKVAGLYMFITPERKHGNPSWAYVNKALTPYYDKIVHKITQQDRTITLKNGSELKWYMASEPDSLRGVTPHGVVFDEFRYMKEEVWNIIRPALSVHKAWAIFISTARGKNNRFYKFWKRGMSKRPEDKDWISWGFRNPDRGLSTSVSPYVSDEEYREMKRDLTDLMFLQEVECHFLDDVGRALNLHTDTIGRATWVDKPEDGIQYMLGIDLGKHEDYTVVTVMRFDGSVAHIYRWRGLDWSIIPDKLFGLSKFWNATAMVDSTGVGDPIFDELMALGMNAQPFKMANNKMKNNLIHRLAQGIDNRVIMFPDPDEHPEVKIMIEEIENYGYRISESGNTIYSAPEGENDDCVISLGLAYYMVYGGLKTFGFKEFWQKKWDEVF